MTTLLYSHPACIEHDPGSNHPECPERLKAVLDGLNDPVFNNLERIEAPRLDIETIRRVHDTEYIERLMDASPSEGCIYLDPDTVLSSGSVEAARRASGAAIDAVDQVMTGKATNAFCAVRPPGHHAESSQAMGFCLFNSAALAAVHARNVHMVSRAAVVDFDVHHGNGTQHSFEGDASLFYASSHQWPAFPGTGSSDESGILGNIVNVPLSPGAGSLEFRKGYVDQILPALRSFNPEILIISSGFDAHSKDPLAQINLVTEDYSWVTEQLLDIAATSCDGRVVALLEGGYDLGALRESVQAHVLVLLAG